MQPKLNLKLELELELEIKLKPKPKLNISCRIYGQRAPLCVCVRGCVCLPFLFFSSFFFSFALCSPFFRCFVSGAKRWFAFSKIVSQFVGQLVCGSCVCAGCVRSLNARVCVQCVCVLLLLLMLLLWRAHASVNWRNKLALAIASRSQDEALMHAASCKLPVADADNAAVLLLSQLCHPWLTCVCVCLCVCVCSSLAQRKHSRKWITWEQQQHRWLQQHVVAGTKRPAPAEANEWQGVRWSSDKQQRKRTT